MAHISTVGEHVASWCPYAGLNLESTATETSMLELPANEGTLTSVEELKDVPCAFIQDGICALAAYSVKNTLKAGVREAIAPTEGTV
jgi:hypothetical protein